MIGAAWSGVSLPSATRRRIASSSSVIAAFRRKAPSRLVDVDLAPLQRAEDRQLLVGRQGCGVGRAGRPRWGRWSRDAPCRTATGCRDRDVARHGAEGERWTSVADDVAPPIATSLAAMGERA